MDKPSCYIDEADLHRFDELMAKTRKHAFAGQTVDSRFRKHHRKAVLLDLKGVDGLLIAREGRRA
jgi:hypothetical protein